LFASTTKYFRSEAISAIMARKSSKSGKNEANNIPEPRIIDEYNHVNESDDEEIDEDEAFNSEDELKYGSFFKSSKKSRDKKKSGKDRNTKKSKNRNVVKLIGQDEEISVEEGDSHGSGSSGDDDSEDDDRSASSEGDDEESEDWAGSDFDGEDDDGGQYMLDLLNNLDKQVPGKSNENKSDNKKGESSNANISLDHVPAAALHLKESEFQAATISMGNNNAVVGDAGKAKKLTLDSLMGGISDTQGFATVQRTMKVLTTGKDSFARDEGETKKLETTKVPVSRVVSERASRKVNYEATSQDVSQWSQSIYEQRDAETLDFRPNKGAGAETRLTKDVLVSKFEAKTDFEEELAKALEVAGMKDEKELRKREKRRLVRNDGHEDGADGFSSDDGDENGIQGEDELNDDLGSNRITLEEYKKRHGELAKMRALLFYEEQKRHRINKIKSKKYRKIRKKQRERQKEAEEAAALAEDPNLEREQMEKDEMERMKERMTLAHKNTSKWARRVLRRGKNVDVEERRALSLQLAKGEELRRKVMGLENGAAGHEDSGGEEEDLLKKARDILMDNEEDAGVPSDVKSKGLFQLEFMKRGMDAQRNRAKEEARKLLEELEANEVAAMSTDSEGESENENSIKSKSTKPKVASVVEIEKVLPDGELVASSLQFGKSDRFAISINGNIELNANAEDKEEAIKVESVCDNDVEETSSFKKKKRKKKQKNCKSKESNSPAAEVITEEYEEGHNPWIVNVSNNTNPGNRAPAAKSASAKQRVSSSWTLNINEAASMLVDDAETDEIDAKRKRVEAEVEEKSNEESKSDDKSNRGVADLSQAELVKRAFASPADLEAEEEFQKEKDRMKDRDDPTRQNKEEKFVSGWGSWAGAGAPPPKKPKTFSSKLCAPEKKPAVAPKRKDDGMSTVIINEKRLKKTAKYQLAEIPHPYRSRAEYEKAIAGNIGQEWNTIHGAKEMSRPAVIVRAGKIIKPIAKKAKARRAPAKF